MPGDQKAFYSSWELYSYCCITAYSLISDQISRLQTRGIRASIVNVSKEPKPEFASDEELDDTGYDTDSDMNVKIDFGLCEEQKLRAGHYQIIISLSYHFCASGTLSSIIYIWRSGSYTFASQRSVEKNMAADELSMT